MGEGSFSQVFKVKRLSDGKEYAMKKVKIQLMKEKEKVLFFFKFLTGKRSQRSKNPSIPRRWIYCELQGGFHRQQRTLRNHGILSQRWRTKKSDDTPKKWYKNRWKRDLDCFCSHVEGT